MAYEILEPPYDEEIRQKIVDRLVELIPFTNNFITKAINKGRFSTLQFGDNIENTKYFGQLRSVFEYLDYETAIPKRVQYEEIGQRAKIYWIPMVEDPDILKDQEFLSHLFEIGRITMKEYNRILGGQTNA